VGGDGVGVAPPVEQDRLLALGLDVAVVQRAAKGVVAVFAYRGEEKGEGSQWRRKKRGEGGWESLTTCMDEDDEMGTDVGSAVRVRSVVDRAVPCLFTPYGVARLVAPRLLSFIDHIAHVLAVIT
jgi:hypothetical protein